MRDPVLVCLGTLGRSDVLDFGTADDIAKFNCFLRPSREHDGVGSGASGRLCIQLLHFSAFYGVNSRASHVFRNWGFVSAWMFGVLCSRPLGQDAQEGYPAQRGGAWAQPA